jgi:hypothetical protein
MRTVRRLLVSLATVVSGSPRKTASDLDEELRAAFEAWARSGSELAPSKLGSADED